MRTTWQTTRDCDILAVFIHTNNAGTVESEYLNKAKLLEFLTSKNNFSKGAKYHVDFVQMHGLLQKFVTPPDVHNEVSYAEYCGLLCMVKYCQPIMMVFVRQVIRAHWNPHMCVYKRRMNLVSFGEGLTTGHVPNVGGMIYILGQAF
jgi:hypothetical protein